MSGTPGRVRESLEQLGSELKTGIHGCGLSAPIFSDIGPNMAVEARVDLAAIKKLGQVFDRMDLSPFQVSRVDDAFPVFVGETRCPDKNITHC